MVPSILSFKHYNPLSIIVLALLLFNHTLYRLSPTIYYFFLYKKGISFEIPFTFNVISFLHNCFHIQQCSYNKVHMS